MTAAQESRKYPGGILLVGGGDLACKMRWSLDYCCQHGIEIHVADVEDDPKLLQTGFRPTAFYNIRRQDEVRRLLQRGAKDPFDLAYICSLPAAHYDNMLMVRTIATRILVTKPSTDFAHYGALETLVKNPTHPWFLQALDEHDHYITKPVVTTVRCVLPRALAECGCFRRVKIFLTERKTIMEEEGRLDALKVGQLPDMGSHGIALIQAFTPGGVSWIRDDGLKITRLGRSIMPTACIEFQANGALALGPRGSSAVVEEVRVDEALRVEYGKRKEETINTFYVLLVCGKSLVVDPAIDADLKAVEVEFADGSRGALDLERNAVKDIFYGLVGPSGVPNREHRGVNLPLQQILSQWDHFIADPEQQLRKSLFQQHEELWEKFDLLWRAWGLAGRGSRLVGIRDKRTIQDLVNGCAVPENGFQSTWRMKTPPSDLIFGSLPNGKKVS